MSKQPINLTCDDSEYNLELILDLEEVMTVKTILGFINTSFNKFNGYDELKTTPPLFNIELKLVADISLRKEEVKTILVCLSSIKPFITDYDTKIKIKQIIKKLREAI